MSSIRETFAEDCFYEPYETTRHRASMEEDYRPNITQSVYDKNLDIRVVSTHDIWLIHNEQELHDVPTTSLKRDDEANDLSEFEELRLVAYQDVCHREHLRFHRNQDMEETSAIDLLKNIIVDSVLGGGG